MNVSQPEIGFIGGGNMAGALIEGLLKKGYKPDQILVIDVAEPTRQRWAQRGLHVSAQPDSTLANCKTWILAVKPQQLKEVVAAAKPQLTAGTLVISIAAGISLSSLCNWLGSSNEPWPAVIRAMPNTPALIGKGITGLISAPEATEAHREMASQILGCVGEVVWVTNDDQIDAVTALSGSGPAYVFRFIEGLIAGGEALGLTREQSRQLAIHTVAGAAGLAAQSDEPVSVLRERVTSKGGTTAAALDVMQNGKLYETIVEAMKAAYKRAGELSAEFGRQD